MKSQKIICHTPVELEDLWGGRGGDLVIADKPISKSVVSFGHIAKPLRFLSVLLMWSKLLCEVTDIDINVTAFSSRMFLVLTVKQVQKLQAKRQHVHVCILCITFTAVG